MATCSHKIFVLLLNYCVIVKHLAAELSEELR